MQALSEADVAEAPLAASPENLHYDARDKALCQQLAAGAQGQHNQGNAALEDDAAADKIARLQAALGNVAESGTAALQPGILEYHEAYKQACCCSCAFTRLAAMWLH